VRQVATVPRQPQPIIPDGCVDIIAVDERPPRVAGPATRTQLVRLQPLSVVVGIRFRPGARGGASHHDEAPGDDAVLAQAKTAGARILIPARETFWGGYDGYFADPDGHLWEIAWNPGWTITDRGDTLLKKP
jgi:catechol 2,3-dioxygenase-like lactoylglutathione lyase family enzyme